MVTKRCVLAVSTRTGWNIPVLKSTPSRDREREAHRVEPAETSFDATRDELHRVAAHILARRRWEVSRRFGLRVTPGGIATPMFGPDGECIRTSAGVLIREVGAVATLTPISGASLRELAKAVDADIDAAFSCGADTPELGDPDRPLYLDVAHLEALARWYQLGWTVLDLVLGRLPDSAEPATLQLWPEHLDVGTNVGLPDGGRVNLGCSPGDSYLAEPYLYVGPWGTARPGEPSYWNAPFGAALAMSEVMRAARPIERGVSFMGTGLDSLCKAAAQ